MNTATLAAIQVQNALGWVEVAVPVSIVVFS